MSCLSIHVLPPDILSLHYRKKTLFFILPSPIFLLTLLCPSWAQVPQVKTRSAHVSDPPVFQNLHDLFPTFAASRSGAWLEGTALNSWTRCPSPTDWSAIYSTTTHSDPSTLHVQQLPSVAPRVTPVAQVHSREELLLAWSSTLPWLI